MFDISMKFTHFQLLTLNFWTRFRNRHNFWWWCPLAKIRSPMESPDSQLSIGTNFVTFGHHRQKLWPNRIGVPISIKFYKTTKITYPYPGMGMNFATFLANLDNLLTSRYRFDSTITFDSDVLRRWFKRAIDNYYNNRSKQTNKN